MTFPDPVRVVLRDSSREIALRTDLDAAVRLLAAVSGQPLTIEEALLTAEAFKPGIVESVVEALLAFDRRRRSDPSSIPLQELTAFEVVDVETARLARTPLEGGLIYLDLEGKRILGAGLTVPESDQVILPSRGGERDPRVTYALPSNWEVVQSAAPDAFPPPLVLAARA